MKTAAAIDDDDGDDDAGDCDSGDADVDLIRCFLAVRSIDSPPRPRTTRIAGGCIRLVA